MPTVRRVEFPPPQTIRHLLADRVDVQHKSVGMVVALIAPDRRDVVAYGTPAHDKSHPPDGDTLFEIASVTKVITCLVLADMVTRGEVALSDPVKKYLPEAVRVPERGGRAITLLDLATHTSGLPIFPPDYPDLSDPAIAQYSNEKLYRFLSTCELPRKSGTQWEYSNVDVALLGDALARRAGVDFETLVRTRVTDPLKMSSTVFEPRGTMADRLATGHDADLRPVPRLSLGAFLPGGGLLSTAHDLLNLLAAFTGLTDSPLASAMAMMLETQRPMRPPRPMLRRHWRMMLKMALAGRGSSPRPVFTASNQAIGWYVLGQGEDRLVVHDGAGFSSAASIAYDPAARAGVVVLSNAGVMVQDISRHLLRPAFPLTPSRQEISLDDAALESYVGDYQSTFGSTWKVCRDAGRLFISMPRLGKVRLRPEAPDRFFTFEFDLEFAAERDAQKGVSQLVLRPSRMQSGASARRVRNPV